MTSVHPGWHADTLVECVACRGSFCPPAPPVRRGERARCPMCGVDVLVGPLHRSRVRVARTGSVATPPRPLHHRGALRAALVSLAVLAVAAVAWGTAAASPDLWARLSIAGAEAEEPPR